MTNLTDLLPAGAGGKQVSFTASGAISSGDTVALQSDGTVITISETSASTGSVTNFDSGTAQSYQTQSVVYDVSQNKILITYADKGNSSYITGVVGTVSGTSISFGTPKVIDSSGVSAAASVYCPDISKTCCFFKKTSNNYTEAKIITISGTTFTNSGSQGLGTTNREAFSPVFDPDNNKVIFNYRDKSNSNYGTTQVCTVTSTTLTAATAVVWASLYAGGSRYGAVYDTLNDKVVVSYIQDTATPRGKSVVGTVSGTSTSWGTPVEFNGGEVNFVDAAFDSNANKVVVVYRDYGSGNDGTVVVGTVSGTSISFGSETFYASGQANVQKIVYDTGAKKSVLIYTDNDGGTGGGGDGRIVEITVDGTTATVANDARVIDDARYDDPGGAYDSSVGRVVFAFRDTSDNDNDAIVHQTSSTNSGDFIGIADAAISDTASGNITIKGGIASNGLSSLTPGSTYYVQNDGTLSTTSSSVTAGKALSATSINLDYSS